MKTKTYIEEAKNKIILKNILLHVCSDIELENKFARIIEDATHGDVTINEFHDWICEFDENEIYN